MRCALNSLVVVYSFFLLCATCQFEVCWMACSFTLRLFSSRKLRRYHVLPGIHVLSCCIGTQKRRRIRRTSMLQFCGHTSIGPQQLGTWCITVDIRGLSLVYRIALGILLLVLRAIVPDDLISGRLVALYGSHKFLDRLVNPSRLWPKSKTSNSNVDFAQVVGLQTEC